MTRDWWISVRRDGCSVTKATTRADTQASPAGRRLPIRQRAIAAMALGLGVLASAAFAAPAGPVWGHGHSYSVPALKRLIVAEADATGVVPPALALAIAKEASDFNNQVTNESGQVGVMQVPPTTAAREFGVSADELWDPVTNVRVALHYLSRLYLLYDGEWELALTHYRGGAPSRQAGRDQPDYTDAYVNRILRWWRLYRWDPVAQMPGPRAPEPVARFERLVAPEYPRFTTEFPPRHRRWSPWVAVTGGARFR